jgi:hypothetical protein
MDLTGFCNLSGPINNREREFTTGRFAKANAIWKVFGNSIAHFVR